jgi:cytochrome c oxidase subunit II
MDAARRHVCLGIASGIAAWAYKNFGLAQALAGSMGQAEEQVVQIQARKFAYIPNQLVLKKGRPALLEFSAVDFTHGFNLPDFKLRADLIQGQVTRVRLLPDRAGTFVFLCDNFCGAGHEEMNGKILVEG